ncbi:MAG TPA: hypothetical protein VHC41_03655, partial [Mycobacteriales bacterium]|nr:hypothetical protein [Mycobacteriales bacterium]
MTMLDQGLDSAIGRYRRSALYGTLGVGLVAGVLSPSLALASNSHPAATTQHRTSLAPAFHITLQEFLRGGRPVLKGSSPTKATVTPSPSAATTQPVSVPSSGVTSSSTSSSGSSAPATSGLPWSPLGGVFGAASVWKLNIASAPVGAGSAAMVSNLATAVTSRYNGVAAFNVDQYTTNFYTVGPNTPRTNVAFNDCQQKGYLPAGLTGSGGQFSDVPIPADATPSAGTDAELTIYSPSTDQLWEFWIAQHTGAGWSACWGGRIDHVSTSPGYFTNNFGATATGLPVAGGMISIQDVKSGSINHAMSLLIPDAATWNNFSYPAQRSDGNSSAAGAIPEGTRFRLDPSLDVTKLGLTPVGVMIARAAQKYGFIVTD